MNKCSIYLQPYPNDEDVELMSKDPSAYVHAHAEVVRLKEEQKREEERNPRSYDDQYHRDGMKKPVKVVSDKLFWIVIKSVIFDVQVIISSLKCNRVISCSIYQYNSPQWH